MLVVDVDSPVMNVWDTGDDDVHLTPVGVTLIDDRCDSMGFGPWRVIAKVGDLVLVRRPGKVVDEISRSRV